MEDSVALRKKDWKESAPLNYSSGPAILTVDFRSLHGLRMIGKLSCLNTSSAPKDEQPQTPKASLIQQPKYWLLLCVSGLKPVVDACQSFGQCAPQEAKDSPLNKKLLVIYKKWLLKFE